MARSASMLAGKPRSRLYSVVAIVIVPGTNYSYFNPRKQVFGGRKQAKISLQAKAPSWPFRSAVFQKKSTRPVPAIQTGCVWMFFSPRVAARRLQVTRDFSCASSQLDENEAVTLRPLSPLAD